MEKVQKQYSDPSSGAELVRVGYSQGSETCLVSSCIGNVRVMKSIFYFFILHATCNGESLVRSSTRCTDAVINPRQFDASYRFARWGKMDGKILKRG